MSPRRRGKAGQAEKKQGLVKGVYRDKDKKRWRVQVVTSLREIEEPSARGSAEQKPLGECGAWTQKRKGRTQFSEEKQAKYTEASSVDFSCFSYIQFSPRCFVGQRSKKLVGKIYVSQA